MTDKTVNLNLDQAAPPALIHVTQGDTSWRWHFPLYLNGARWPIPTGAIAILKGVKPDGHVFAYTASIASNEAVVDAQLQMTVCAGSVGCTLILIDAAYKRLHAAKITLLVAADPEGSVDVASDSALPAYAELLSEYAELGPKAAAAMAAANEALAIATAAVAAVNSAGTTQISAVNQAGTAQVGNVNIAGAAQVQAVEDKGEEVLESIPADYSDLSEEVEGLKSAITHIKNITSTSKALLIGDSYNYGSGGTQPYGWGYYLQQLSGATCDIVHQNGGGFTTAGASIATYPDKTYVQLVADLDASKNYDFVIVQNGQNDGNHGSVSGINTAVPAFLAAIKAKYPNALVWIIPVWNDSGIAEAKNDILKATAEQAIKNGARTCFNSWQWMVGTGTNSDYENHLTDAGYQLLAKYIYELINGWSGEKNNLLKDYVGVYPINPNNASIAARGQAYQHIYGNLSIFHAFFRCTSAVARTEVIYKLASGYTYDTLSNVYITTATSDPTATVNLTAGGNVVVSSNDGLATTPSEYPWNPYEIWLITSCRKNQ